MFSIDKYRYSFYSDGVARRFVDARRVAVFLVATLVAVDRLAVDLAAGDLASAVFAVADLPAVA
jgi:hypothetical protein